MKITKPDDVLFLQGSMQKGGRNFLVATVGYVLEADGSLLPEAQAWAWLMEYFPQQPFDLGLKKNRGTFAVAGKAYAPGGQATMQMAVRAGLGSLQKTLHVYGNRHWEGGLLGWRATAPQPFTSMPVDLEHAFGGKDHPDNPLGVGWASPPDAADGQALPNIEWPDTPVTRPDDATPPATFGNLHIGAQSQAKLMGTVDEKWHEQRFPGLPDDHDERWFDAVAQDQSQPQYWRGDESWSVTGMHPQRDTVQGKLPGLRPDMVFQRGATSPWQEDAPLSGPEQAGFDLDTVWLFPNEERVVLLYRASIPVQREDGADIVAAGITTAQAGDAPLTVPQLTEQWLENDFSALDYLPQALGVAGALAAGTALAIKVKDYYDDKKKEEDAKKAKQAAAQQQPAPPPPAAPAPASPATPVVAETAAPQVSHAEQWADNLWKEITDSYAESWEEGRHMLQLLEEDNKEHLPFSLGDFPPFVPPPRPSLHPAPLGALPANFAGALNSEIQDALAEGKEMFELAIRDAVAEHPELMADMLARLNSPLPGPAPTLEQLEEIVQDLPEEDQQRLLEAIQQMEANFAQLDQEIASTLFPSEAAGAAGAALGMEADAETPETREPAATDADTSPGHAAGTATPAPAAPGNDTASDDATGSDNTPAAATAAAGGSAAASAAAPSETHVVPPEDIPVSAPPPPAREQIVLSDQDFQGADLKGADYQGAVLQNCNFSGAQMNGADLSGASLQGCNFSGADLSGAKLAGADASAVDLRNASLAGAGLVGATIAGSNLNGINLSQADLTRTTFDDCFMDKACLDHSILSSATFSDVHGEGMSFVGSRADGLRLDSGTRLPQADFSQATLAGASFQNSHLPQAQFHGSDMNQAFFKASDMSGSTAQAAQAGGATFKDVLLKDASWQQSNLMHASFDNSLLHNVDFSHSNLYGTQTRLASVQGVRTQNAVMDLSELLKGVSRA